MSCGPFTFLIAPVESVGHFNACIGIGQQLLKRRHRVVFVTPNIWRQKLVPLGFEEVYYQDEDPAATDGWGDLVIQMAPILGLPAIQKLEFLMPAFYAEAIKKVKNSDSKMRRIMEQVKPNVVLVDDVVRVPALMDNGVPWILVTSLAPVGVIVSEHLPPGFSGYPVFNADKKLWEKYSDKATEVLAKTYAEYRAWVIEQGGPAQEFSGSILWQGDSPFANICMYPAEMCYSVHSPFPPKWHRFDAFVRREIGEFQIPKTLENLPGKLIYFSLGTTGTSELVLMEKLIRILAKSPNRFIVSKGPLGDKLKLASNMWGANSVPQTLVLPQVDLVISHGGNNTVTESFYFGKPLIILPIGGDQNDNATRVEETGHGLQFLPYDVTEEQLLNGIEQLVNDELLKERMRSIGIRIRSSNCQARAADVVESVAIATANTN